MCVCFVSKEVSYDLSSVRNVVRVAGYCYCREQVTSPEQSN